VDLVCAAACLDCDWTESAASMKAADKACDRHARETKHATSWHCQPAGG
jgi:hypothetical protein